MSTELLSSMQQLQGMGLMAAAGPATTEPLPKSRYRLTKLAISAVVLGLLQATAADAEPIAARHEPIPDQVWEEMQGSSWHPNRGCPARESLALLTVPYRDFAGETRLGRLVFAKRVANQVASIFTEIFESQKFRIERMELVDKFRGDDDASMAANNTSAFNCRFVAGTTALSAHATTSIPSRIPSSKARSPSRPKARPSTVRASDNRPTAVASLASSCRVMSLLRPSSGRAGSGVEIGAARRTISTSRRTAASR